MTNLSTFEGFSGLHLKSPCFHPRLLWICAYGHPESSVSPILCRAPGKPASFPGKSEFLKPTTWWQTWLSMRTEIQLIRGQRTWKPRVWVDIFFKFYLFHFSGLPVAKECIQVNKFLPHFVQLLFYDKCCKKEAETCSGVT